MTIEIDLHLEDNFENFHVYPKCTQDQIEKEIVIIFYESFVETADEDYITASFLAKEGMYRAFYWSASQAIEKYLKAFLLFRGQSVRNISHDSEELFNKAISIDQRVADISVKYHPSITFCESLEENFVTVSTKEFIKLIDSHGHSSNRYNKQGVEYETSYVLMLDSFIYHLRKLVGFQPIENSYRNISDVIIESFLNYNPWFNNKPDSLESIPNENFNLSYGNSNTTLERYLNSTQASFDRPLKDYLKSQMKI